MYYFSMILVLGSSLFYHISQKNISQSVNPIISLIATYITALILSVLMFFFFPIEKGDIVPGFKSLNAFSYVLGGAIVLLEVGYLMVYRSGWNISIASIVVNSVVMAVLIPVGVLLYKESISLQQAFGIVLCMAGIIFINKG